MWSCIVELVFLDISKECYGFSFRNKGLQQRHCEIPEPRIYKASNKQCRYLIAVNVRPWHRFVLQAASQSQKLEWFIFRLPRRVFIQTVVAFWAFTLCSAVGLSRHFRVFHVLHLRKSQLQRFKRLCVCVCRGECVGHVGIHAVPQMFINFSSLRRVFQGTSDKINIDCFMLRIILRNV